MSDSEPVNCFICDKHQMGSDAQGGVLYEDGLLYVGHLHSLSGPTVYRGWLLVEPLRHAPGLGDLTPEEAAAIGQMTSRLARLLSQTLGAEHVYSFVLGDQVPHLHVHIAPRYPRTPDEYRAMRLDDWPDAPRVTEPEMRALVSELREQLPVA